MGRAARVSNHRRREQPMEECPMPQRDDLSRSLVPFQQDGTLVAVVELSRSSWLVAGWCPGSGATRSRSSTRARRRCSPCSGAGGTRRPGRDAPSPASRSPSRPAATASGWRACCGRAASRPTSSTRPASRFPAALSASVVGRQTAGRVMPARWAMHEADFEVLLHLVERLSDEQRAALGRALASASGEPEAVRLIEGAFAAAPRCPHCAAARLQRWGHASGLRRYRCQACRKTFNALTGTSLARLRKKECWLRYGEALAAGMTLAKAAAHCGVHLTTSFRWRHRFLRAPAAA